MQGKEVVDGNELQGVPNERNESLLWWKKKRSLWTLLQRLQESDE